MGFLSSLFGKKDQNVAEAAVAASTITGQADGSSALIEEVMHQIELTEGELHDTQDQLSAATDPTIKSSLEMLVTRKSQAITDLHEKLTLLQKNSSIK